MPLRSSGILKSQARWPFLDRSALRLHAFTSSRPTLGCPVVPLFPFLGGLGSLINPFLAKKGTLFKPRLLGSLALDGSKTPLSLGFRVRAQDLGGWLTMRQEISGPGTLLRHPSST